MHRRDIQLVGLLAWLVLAGNLGGAATGGTNIPSPGSTTSDGFTVSAQWHVQYEFKDVVHWKLAKSEAGFLNVRREGVYTINTTAKADVTEEVNKQTGQLRAVLRGGEWHWRDTSHGDHSASGGFSEPVISHWWDAQAGKTMVGFSISPTDPANIKELVKAGSLPNIGELACEVAFETRNLTYREIRLGPPGTNWESNLIITRTEQKLEAEIKPGDGFKEWVPTMTGVIPFEVRLVSPPDLPVQWKISLYKTSNLPGVCCNAGLDNFTDLAAQWQNQIKKDSYDLIFDFRKYGKTDPSFKPVDGPWQVLETSKPVNSFAFAVNCLDYGASGRVMALAEFEGEVIAAKYKETGETFVRIPYSTSNNDSHRIAHAAKPDGSVKTYDQLSGGKPDADDDSYPESNFKGDGLSVFEEYRGFYVGDHFSVQSDFRHRRLDPEKKDLFVFSETWASDLLQHLGTFHNASGLTVHWAGLVDDQHFVRARDRVINFNSTEAAAKPQCAIFLTADGLSNGTLGKSFPVDDRLPGFGPPRYVSRVVIDYWQASDTAKRWGIMPELIRQLVVHEMGHAIGMRHHGDTNDSSKGIAIEGGQNSGDAFCAMRYIHWRWYLHKLRDGQPQPTPQRYRWKREGPAFGYCDSPLGTGLNKIGTEDWHCGNASPGRGNCLSQIRVNDRAPQPAGSAGGGHWSSAGDATPLHAPAFDAAEKAAQDSQRRAGVSFALRLRHQRAITPGEALILELTLGKPAKKAAAGKEADTAGFLSRLGSKEKPWTQLVAFSKLGPDGKPVPLGMPVRPIEGAADPQIELDPGARHAAAFAVDGTETAKLPPGVHGIVATISADNTTITSRTVTLEVVDPWKLNATQRKEAETSRKLSPAFVEFAAEHWPEAERTARAVCVEAPDSLEAHLLLAQSLEKQAKLKEAYDEYERALSCAGQLDEQPHVIFAALERLEAKLGIEPPPPKTVAAAAAFTLSLFAETPTGKAAAPFPRLATKLVGEWKLAQGSLDDPLGVRWIAENVPGVEKNHLIATSKSELDKNEGEFSLKKPTAGFPPGQYRVEIWQTGKMIYSEKFEIKSE